MRNILLLTILTLVGCTYHAAYTAFQPVQMDSWVQKDELKFEIDAVCPPGEYALNICVRTTEAKRLNTQRIPLKVTQTWEHLTDTLIDTLVITLTDKHGRSSGKGINHHDIITRFTTFEMPDTLRGTITIAPQATDTIHGLTHVGLEITAIEK